MDIEYTNYEGQTALITGATSGIGLELAHCFAEDGYDIVLVSRHIEDLKKIGKELQDTYGVQTYELASDLMLPGGAQELYNRVKEHGLRIDVLVNDAGQGIWGNFIDTDLDKELDIIQLNISSVVVLTKLFLREMVARNSGKILQLASTASKAPSPLLSVYAATKAFVYNFTLGLINELKDTNVTMTALMPGPTNTDFFHKAGAEQTVVYLEADLADPADVARDGYEALQDGATKVVSGFKNKVQSAISNFMSDEALAEQTRQQMNPSEKENKNIH
jgi:short-subunit dehydrogenase